MRRSGADLIVELEAAADADRADAVAAIARFLACSDGGLEAIRRWLEHQRAVWGVRELMVVAEGEHLGRQVFRAGGEPIVAGWPARVALHEPVGLYTDPPLALPLRERELVARLCYLGLELDVSKQRCMTDPLTGLQNRAAFDASLQAATENAVRYGWRTTLVLIDLDRFKQLNDDFGHLAGDIGLRALATELRRHVRRGDTAARLGGDEFALLLADIPEPELRTLLGRLADAAASAGPHTLSFSWGAVSTPDDGTDPTGLYRLADQHLYEYKARS